MTITDFHNQYGYYLTACLHKSGIPLEECEDARQDIYLKLLELKFIIRDNCAKGLCSKIAKHYAIDRYRKQSIRSEMVDIQDLTVKKELDQATLFDWLSENGKSAMDLAIEAVSQSESFMVADGISAFMLINDVFNGMTQRAMAEKYGVAPMTINRWLKRWYKHARTI